MTYAISDIHGRYDKYQRLLEKIHFGPEDILYVLGDVLDRGPHGFKILLDMAGRPNVRGILGNHEAMAIDALSVLLPDFCRRGEPVPKEDEADKISLWFGNGGESSLMDFAALDEEQAMIVWKTLRELPLYLEAEAGGRKYLLVHGGLDGFSPDRPLENYSPEEILWSRPSVEMVYYPDRLLIFGHTPVQLLHAQRGGREHSPQAKIFRKGTAFDIDCGCVFAGGRLGCLCLDTLEEIYV